MCIPVDRRQETGLPSWWIPLALEQYYVSRTESAPANSGGGHAPNVRQNFAKKQISG